MPVWLKRHVPNSGKKEAVSSEIAKRNLHTVCDEAKCPNRGECFSKGTATFLILGDVCSRNCTFCSVSQGMPKPPDPLEPRNIVEAALTLRLTYVVITSVTRDDLPDGGAHHFAHCISSLKETIPGIGVEVLIPDLKGDAQSLDIVLCAKPDVFNHNIETVPSLYPTIRPMAEYKRSLDVLSYAAHYALRPHVKSGLMVGLGETPFEVEKTLRDIFAAGVDIITIGQYLRPSPTRAPVVEYITPDQFDRYASLCKEIGFKKVFCGPFVRSSYHAQDIASMADKTIIQASPI